MVSIMQDRPGLLLYSNLTIGNPPQPFTVHVDLSWTDLFVPSSNCTERTCREDHATYNSSRSSSRVVNGSATDFNYWGFNGSGIISQDTLHIAGLNVKNQHFQEITKWRPPPGYWNECFDGVLGLALPDLGQTQNILHPLSLMVSQNLLARKECF